MPRSGEVSSKSLHAMNEDTEPGGDLNQWPPITLLFSGSQRRSRSQTGVLLASPWSGQVRYLLLENAPALLPPLARGCGHPGHKTPSLRGGCMCLKPVVLTLIGEGPSVCFFFCTRATTLSSMVGA